MVIEDGLKEIEYPGETRIAIGKFDGIHAGHQKLIKELTKDEGSLKSVVFTFSVASKVLINKDDRILSDDERHKKFSDLGVDYLIEYDLNEQSAKMEPEEFARVVLKDRLHCAEIICGPDLTFGYKGRGTVALLKDMEQELDIKVTVIDKVKYNGEDISSTRIRAALKAGNISDAENMMRG